MSVEAAPLAAARRRRGRWVAAMAVSAVVLVAGVAAWILLQPKSSSLSTMSTVTAAKRTISVTVSGTGSTVAASSVTVNPEISGTVETLDVSLGETVTAGQTLYTISSDSVENSLLQARASLLQSRQSLTNANSQYKQAQNQLYGANTQKIQAENALDKAESQPTSSTDYKYNVAVAQRQLTSANKAVAVAKLGVTAAEQGLEVAEANLSSAEDSYSTALKQSKETAVTAPIDGVITALPISVGSAVSAGTNSSSSSSASSGGGDSASAGGSGSSSSGSGSSSSSSGSGSSITITDMGTLQVELTVSEVDIPKVAVGQAATVSFDAISGKTFAGTVKSIMPNATSSSGVVDYTVYIKLNETVPQLRTGMTANVDIQTQTASDVVALPSTAIKTNNGEKYVLVVAQGGRTVPTSVTVGASDDTYSEIVSGVTAGTVVSTGSSTSSTSSGSSSSSSSKSSSRGTSAGGFMMGAGGPPSGGPGGGGPGGN